MRESGIASGCVTSCSAVTGSSSAIPHSSSASSCTSIAAPSARATKSSTSGWRASASSPTAPNTRTNASRWRSARSVSPTRPRVLPSAGVSSSSRAVFCNPVKISRGASTGVCTRSAGGCPGRNAQSPSRQRKSPTSFMRICAPSSCTRSFSLIQPSSSSAWPRRSCDACAFFSACWCRSSSSRPRPTRKWPSVSLRKFELTNTGVPCTSETSLRTLPREKISVPVERCSEKSSSSRGGGRSDNFPVSPRTGSMRASTCGGGAAGAVAVAAVAVAAVAVAVAAGPAACAAGASSLRTSVISSRT